MLRMPSALFSIQHPIIQAEGGIDTVRSRDDEREIARRVERYYLCTYVQSGGASEGGVLVPQISRSKAKGVAYALL